MSDTLRLQHVSKSFKSGDRTLRVLHDISFSLTGGASCAIVGPSGSGKTTLLGLCAGLDLPSSGTIFLNDINLQELQEDERARLRNHILGFVFQNFQLIPTLTALENVMVPLEIRGEKRARQNAQQLLDEVGLAERMHHYPVQLSGGEQQRVALARAFINQPQILFADEPTGNLDGDTGAHIQALLFDMNHTHNTTLVIATHDMELAHQTDRMLRLKNGQLISDEKTKSQKVTLGSTGQV